MSGRPTHDESIRCRFTNSHESSARPLASLLRASVMARNTLVINGGGIQETASAPGSSIVTVRRIHQAAPSSSFRVSRFSSAITTTTQGLSKESIHPLHSRVPTLPRFRLNSCCGSPTVRLSLRTLKW